MVIYTLVALCPVAMAQSEEELQILELFYTKKDLVVTTSRYPKPISQVAENITIISAEEIEMINAHSVAEILKWIPGVNVSFSQDFGDTSLIGIQGAEDRHSLLLLDGIPWNYLSGGNAETHTIPVGIIERIEIIKGPASSAWGSSLGGVINIITKSAGTQATPQGSVRASVGEAASLDVNGQVYGKTGPLGYYLFAGHQSSDGLRGNRDFETQTLFAKLQYAPSETITGEISAGYSEPFKDLGTFPFADLASNGDLRTWFTRFAVDATLTDQLAARLAGHFLDQDVTVSHNLLGLWDPGTTGDLFFNSRTEEQTAGLSAQLFWRPKHHTLVLGVDLSHGDLDQTNQAGPLLQSFLVPAMERAYPDITQWAVYANDTLLLGPWTLITGARFDHNDLTGSFFSPSLGVTWRFRKDTLFRTTVSRGFHFPPLALIGAGGLFLDPNPDLDAETVWSYQVGFETATIPYLWLKGSLFLHDQDDNFETVPFGGGPPRFNNIVVNSTDQKIRGVEVELKSTPIWHLSVHTGISYAHKDEPDDFGNSEIWSGSVALSYDDGKTLRARLTGLYMDWDVDPSIPVDTSDMIWDFNAAKTVFQRAGSRLTLFVSIHNLFDGSQYTNVDNENPTRWLEGGIAWAF